MSHEEQRMGQGQGVSKGMPREGESGIAKTPDLSPEDAKGLCPLACTTQEGGGVGVLGMGSHMNWHLRQTE